MTESLKDRIMRHEGFCAVPRIDVAPMYVIGFGHDITKAECDNYPHGISYADALSMLDADIVKAKQNAATEFPWVLGLDYCRTSVIYEMCFQLGVGGVAEFKNMIAAIRSQNWELAAKEMLESKWHKQTPSRAEELAELMLTGEST